MRCLVRFRYEDHKATLISIRDGRATIVMDGYEASDSIPLGNLVEAGGHIDEMPDSGRSDS